MQQSPFPGMDPYIEACDRWEDFHGKLIGEIEQALAQSVPDRYFVLVGERSYIVLTSGENERREYLLESDVAVTSRPGREETAPQAGGSGIAAVASETEPRPVSMLARVETEHRETFVEIRGMDRGQRLITCIELLSPSNKRPGTKGWEQHRRKRQGLLQGDANLVEIDLLRKGRRMPMAEDWPDSPSYLLLCWKERAPRCTVWPAYITHALPTIPIPLESPDQDINLAIQPLVEAVYARSRYSRLLDYDRRLRPALTAAESGWVEQRLREWNSPK